MEVEPDDTGTRRSKYQQLEMKLVDALRKEAYDVRDCFTRHAFQAMAVVGAMSIAIVKFQADDHWGLGMLSALPGLLLIAVTHMGLHKYGTSNRLLGFELYLDRTKHYTKRDGFHPKMREVGWEEAMRAWRVVSYTMSKEIYLRNRNALFYEFWTVRPPRGGIPDWCDPARITKEANAHYGSGGYLRIIVIAIFILLGFNVFNGIASAIYSIANKKFFWIGAIGTLFIPIFALCGLRMYHIWTRLGAVENELHSIHSTSIVWEATIMAHFLALNDVRLLVENSEAEHRDEDGHRSMHGYTQALAARAHEVAERRDDLHKKISEMRKKVVMILVSKG